MRQFGLGILFFGQDRGATAAADGVKQSVQGASRAAKDAKLNYAALGVASAAVALAIGSVALAAGDFERRVARVANISGATGEELSQLRDAAVQAGIATQFSPAEAIDGLAALASQGFTSAESMKLLDQALALAAGGMIGVEEASRASAAAIRVFGDNVGDVSTVADRLLKITNLTSLQANDLSLALGTVSRGAGLTKQSLDEMLISMGLVRNSGVDASVAASSVSSALLFAAKNADVFKKKLGISITKSSGEFKDFLDIVTEFDSVASKKFANAATRSAVTMKLFGRFGVTAVQNVSAQLKNLVKTRDDIGTVEEAVIFMRKQLEGASGTAKQFADSLNNTFAGSVTLLSGTLQTLAIVIGEPIAAALKPLVRGVTAALNFIIRAFEALPGPVKKAFGFVATAVAGIAAIGAAVAAVAGAVALLGPPLAAVGAAVGTAIAAAAPFIAIAAAIIGAVIAIVFAVKNNFLGLGDLFDATIGRVILAFKAVISLFREGGFSDALDKELSDGNQGVRDFALSIFAFGFRIFEFFRGVASGFREAILPPIMRVGRSLSRIGTAIGRIFTVVFGVFRRLGQALGILAKTGKDASTAIPAKSFFESGAAAGRLFAGALGLVIDAVDFLVSGFASLVEHIADFAEFVGDALGSALDFVISFGKGAIEAMSPLVDFFEFLADKIADVIQAAKDAAEFVGNLPNAALSAVGLGGTETSEVTADTFLDRLNQNEPKPIRRQVTGLETSTFEPAGATERASQQAPVDLGPLIDAVKSLADRPVTVQTADGETLFETVQGGSESAASRGFDVSTL